MSAITRTVIISIHEMAQAFCEMQSDQQAEFFNEIAKQVQENWDAPFSAQVKFILESPVLTEKGLEIMESFHYEE